MTLKEGKSGECFANIDLMEGKHDYQAIIPLHLIDPNAPFQLDIEVSNASRPIDLRDE